MDRAPAGTSLDPGQGTPGPESVPELGGQDPGTNLQLWSKNPDVLDLSAGDQIHA